MTIHKKFLVEELDKELKITQINADYIVRDIFGIISEQLIEGKDVKLSGFGNFTLRDKKARPGRNVSANEAVMVQPRRVVTFKSGVKVRSIIKEKVPELIKKFKLD